MKRIIAGVTLVLLLGGCAAAPRPYVSPISYVEPKGVPWQMYEPGMRISVSEYSKGANAAQGLGENFASPKASPEEVRKGKEFLAKLRPGAIIPIPGAPMTADPRLLSDTLNQMQMQGELRSINNQLTIMNMGSGVAR